MNLIGKEHFDIIGFSLAVEDHVDLLAGYINAVRKGSLNNRVGIMVGGPVFALYPEYAARVHADVVATSGHEAPEIAEKVVTAQRARI
jgi:methylmalonyl-CoA mutase cobalamin-binding subunit